ncbi:MAG: BrnT family toxin [Gammaproteobacteria bacterium]|nr:MAG: BrnT family toxin [Gammaproteobacteria bacterium]
MEFEWDPEKSATNLAKHGVSFEEATEVFGDELSSTISDPDHSESEERFVIFGCTREARHLVVGFTERGAKIRIITARPMTPRERNAYEQ